jgi:acyl-CoA synthetase (AMP-forming)/AMP-acid ligase II
LFPSEPILAAATLVEVVKTRAATTPDRLAFRWLVDGEEEGPRLTDSDLDRQARCIALALQHTVDPGDRALLLYAPGLEFIPAFFGCLYAGVVAVPAYPPRLDRLAQSWQTLGGIAADCRPNVVLATRSIAALFGGSAAIPPLGELPWICTDALDASGANAWHERPCAPEGLAFLQYTSGSTAAPRGVRVTHRNLIHNQHVMQAALGPDGPGLGVSWLPLYHDMGLVGGVFQPVFHGTPCLLMSPLGLLQKPIRWLRAISRYRARTGGGPAFAYELCAERITPEQKVGLDLSKWTVAVLGGEPVSARTLERFAAAFGPCGFRPEGLGPCYGLAEATLLVAASGAPAARVLPTGHVSCGPVWLDQRVAIIHPESMTRCSPGEVGEIWVSGPSVADGYWGRPEETERTFRAFLRDTGEGPFLRTGDLGFLDGGELFVTGRLKDLIIIRGRNHYPQDIEATVQGAHPGLRANGGAAFEVRTEDGPLLVVVQEVERGTRDLDPARLLGDVRQAVAERHDLHLHDLQLLEFGSLPKTSSGKVQRHLCRLGYQQGTLKLWNGARRA